MPPTSSRLAQRAEDERREHGYTVLAHDVARQLMELPEPAAGPRDAPPAADGGAAAGPVAG